PTLSALYNDDDYSLNIVPLVPISQLDLINPGEMYVKRVYKPVFVSSFVRSYQAAKAGAYRNFSGGFSELPRNEKGFDALKYSFTPKCEGKGNGKLSLEDIYNW
ncbi:MAG: hypothetical protein FWH57_13385, partial [Oscillospiraceae bacterium]|nr:hypothetical protein [Oscillospiraceae bacterium]